MMKTGLVDVPGLLAPFGFSEIEALVYAFLLQEGLATGYRVSHGIGKPTANTYKALSSLAARGAITVEEGEGRLCRAVPPGELLDRLEKGFRDRKAQALSQLDRLQQSHGDDRIYQLEDADQVLARAKAMLDRAQSIVLLDIFPAPFAALKPDLKAAVARGVRVALQVYEPVTLPRAEVVLSDAGADLLASWPGQQLSLVVDAREHLLALLGRDGRTVHQAIWSGSTFLSCMQHNALACELLLRDRKGGEGPARRLQKISLLQAAPPGLEELKARFGGTFAPGNPQTKEGPPKKEPPRLR